MIKEILLLGDQRLYQKSELVSKTELPYIESVAADMHDTLNEFRRVRGAGRAIAAPQIGVMKRLIYMNVGTPVVIINPELEFIDEERMGVWDDCMSFPGLFAQVIRYRRCTLKYRDIAFNEREMKLEGDMSELIQHEYDHLDGILATMRTEGPQGLSYYKFGRKDD